MYPHNVGKALAAFCEPLPMRPMIRRVPRSRCLGSNPSGSAVLPRYVFRPPVPGKRAARPLASENGLPGHPCTEARRLIHTARPERHNFRPGGNSETAALRHFAALGRVPGRLRARLWDGAGRRRSRARGNGTWIVTGRGLRSWPDVFRLSCFAPDHVAPLPFLVLISAFHERFEEDEIPRRSPPSPRACSPPPSARPPVRADPPSWSRTPGARS